MSMNVGRTSLRALFMKGWNEMPEVVAAQIGGIIGIFGCVVGAYRYYANDGDNKRYKNGYVVYRPEDPRCAKVHKD